MKDPRKFLQQAATWLAVLILMFGVCVVLGWEFRIPQLKGQTLGTFVAPNAALSFGLAAISILLQLHGRDWGRLFGVAIGWCVTLFAVATISEYLFRFDLGIDRLFMAHRLSDWTLPLPGRYSINTTIGFTLAGLSLVTLRRRFTKPLTEYAALVVIFVSYLSLIAYLYGAPQLYSRVMAVQTAVMFSLLGLALLCAPPRPVIAGILLDSSAGAVASRKMVTAIILLLPAFGAIQLWAEEGNLLSLRFGIAVSVIASVTFFTALALYTAASLNEAERKRNEMEAALLRSGQIAAAGRMAASIAHEVNNPLESITNIIYLLKHDGLPTDLRRTYLDAAEGELIRVAAIARRTLGFYREESKPTEFELGQLLDSVLDVYRHKLDGRILVHRRYSPDARIFAKAGEVRQVLANLIANAIDSMDRAEGRLDISTSIMGANAIIEISDNGCGIRDHDLERIFDPFFTTKKDVGTGLGLWVSRELIARNQGTISVASSTDTENHGTVFTLIFPLAAPATRAEAEPKEAARAESTSRSA